MDELILQTLDEEDVKKAVFILESKGLLVKSKSCELCENNLENIGGFLPKDGKIIVICDNLKCIIEASFLIMKFNGNGSPIIEK